MYTQNASGDGHFGPSQAARYTSLYLLGLVSFDSLEQNFKVNIHMSNQGLVLSPAVIQETESFAFATKTRLVNQPGVRLHEEQVTLLSVSTQDLLG